MEPPRNAAFASTGPHGHRGRMRTRLLADPAALADYEIVEMLLFLGIPRRDTKPQAKALINRFGTLAGTMAAGRSEWREAGLPAPVMVTFEMVADAADALAQAEVAERPRLHDWPALAAYLRLPVRAKQPPGFSALLLDSRNQLLAEHRWKTDADEAVMQRELLRHALSRHAAAVILVRSAGDAAPVPVAADRERHGRLHRAAAALSVVLHDTVVIGAGEWSSLLRKDGVR